MAKAIIYVPWLLVNAFKLNAEEHELEMKFLYNDLVGNAVFEELNIEVSVYSEILEEV